MKKDDHALDRFIEEDGWATGLCSCGLKTPPCPDTSEAANLWGQHLLIEAWKEEA